MSDNYEHDKPYSLTATYQTTPESSELTTPYDLHVLYDPDYVANAIDFKIDADFQLELVATFTESSTVSAVIDTKLDSELQFELEATFSSNLCTIDTILDTGFSFEVEAIFDINHLVGVFCEFGLRCQKAITSLSTMGIPWAKPILRVSNEALFCDQSLVISNQVDFWHEQAGSLTRAVRTLYEQTTRLSSDAYIERWIRKFEQHL